MATIHHSHFLFWVFIMLRLSVMGNIVPFKVLLLVLPAVQVVPDLRFGDRIMSLFALPGILTACCFHNIIFRQ